MKKLFSSLPSFASFASVAAMAATVALALATASVDSHAQSLRYSTQDEPQTLDPHSANLAVTTRLIQSVYEGLVMRDKDFKIVPALAIWWSQPDQKTWRFRLRQNVKFHDGSVLTADDVVFSVERALMPTSQLKSSLQGVASAKKVDANTVDLIMKEPNPVLVNHLVSFRIMNKAWSIKNNSAKPQDYKNKEDTFASRNANGTGPFMVKLRQPDVKTVLVAHADWWNKSAPDVGNLKEVTFLPVKSNATRVAALLSGEIDFINDTPYSDVARLRTTPKTKINEFPEGRVQYLAFDMHRDELQYSNVKGKNPFKDLKVRQAIAHAIDAEAIKTKVMRGLSRPTGSIITPSEQGYSKDADVRLPYNVERGKTLLTEAGYPNGFEVTLDCGNNQPAADICQAIPPMLAQIGIKVKPNIVPTANYFAKIQKFDTSMYLLAWGTPTFDALYTLAGIVYTHGGDGTGNGDSNYGRYSNPRIDKLIDRIKVEFDMPKRNAAIREVLMTLNADLPFIPIHQPLIPWAMRSNVNAVTAPNNIANLYRFSVE
jgi:peptide/nickel transport system substrate-binding protein